MAHQIIIVLCDNYSCHTELCTYNFQMVIPLSTLTLLHYSIINSIQKVGEGARS